MNEEQRKEVEYWMRQLAGSTGLLMDDELRYLLTAIETVHSRIDYLYDDERDIRVPEARMEDIQDLVLGLCLIGHCCKTMNYAVGNKRCAQFLRQASPELKKKFIEALTE